MSDQNKEVRLLASNTFATLIKLVPLDGSMRDPEGLPQDLSIKRAEEKKFLDQLLNVKNLEPFDIPVQIEASLRSYQLDGIKWLAFLNKYRLHGILQFLGLPRF